MDDLYIKNGRSINNQLLSIRITAIRSPILKRYVEHLLGSPQSRLTISEEINLQVNKSSPYKLSLQPHLVSQRYESNISKESIDVDIKRLIAP
jgi:hypothetical protein